MPSSIEHEQEITVGAPVVIECPSPSTQHSVVFEDDGETGYFYALSQASDIATEHPIQDALHIYNVDAVVDKAIPSTVQIVWSSDGMKSALVINRYPHAVFDFAAKRGYCRTGFPPTSCEWADFGHAWDDAAIDPFK